jgi:NitT/TauT family transport system substrate-binding protein
MLDPRVCGIGERIVFEPYTREMYERTHRWMLQHQLFERAEAVQPDYEAVVL